MRVHTCCMFCVFGQKYDDIYQSLQYPADYFHCPKNAMICLFISLPKALAIIALFKKKYVLH